jgi:hypothetical protein
MEGTDPMEKLRKAYWSTYKTNLGVWSTVQLGNFALVPLEYRVLVVNVVSLGESSFETMVLWTLANLYRMELLLELCQQQGLIVIIVTLAKICLGKA